ncbi:MAG: DUF3332 family protein [Bacteriovoracaceae bacterium]|nr:DUF3332 domain-containing protein [Bacteroidota bacterium]
MNKFFKKMVVLVLVATMAMMSVGCYGSFALTKKVYNWNGSLGNKWVIEIVYLVISYPVYGVAGFIDSVILNSIEFWTGSNPMSSVLKSEDGSQVAFNAEKKEITVSYADKKFIIGMVNGKATVMNEQGVAIAYVESDDSGTMTVKDMKGNVLSVQSKADMMAMVDAQ